MSLRWLLVPCAVLISALSCRSSSDSESNPSVIDIYEGDDGHAVFADTTRNKGLELISDENSVFTVLQISSDKLWAIIERAPAEPGHGRLETEHLFISSLEHGSYVMSKIDESLSDYPLFLETSGKEDFLIISRNVDKEPLRVSLAEVSPGAFPDRVRESLTRSFAMEKASIEDQPASSSHELPEPNQDLLVLESAGASSNGETGFDAETGSSRNRFPVIVPGSGTTVMLVNKDSLYAWGRNKPGSPGEEKATSRTQAEAVDGLEDIETVATGGAFHLALGRDGKVRAWGSNKNGELGNGTSNYSNAPVLVSNLEDIVAIACGTNHSLALRKDGTVWAWGLNDRGQLGDGTTTDRHSPVRTRSIEDVAQVAGSRAHSLALSRDGTVWSWGRNESGQLGDGTNEDQLEPVHVVAPYGKEFLSDATKIAAGGAYKGNSAAILVDGTLLVWGGSDKGQIANGKQEDGNRPQPVEGLTNVVSISIGGQHILALNSGGEVWAWGYNWNGQLGLGFRDDRFTPMRVPGLEDVSAIGAGDNHSVAVQSDGTVWLWGSNYFGQLGVDTPQDFVLEPIRLTSG